MQQKNKEKHDNLVEKGSPKKPSKKSAQQNSLINYREKTRLYKFGLKVNRLPTSIRLLN